MSITLEHVPALTAGIDAITDQVAKLVEPDSRFRDDSLGRPTETEIAPGVLYCWPSSEAFLPDGQGQEDRETWTIGVCWAVERGAETGGGSDREISLAITIAAETLRAAIRSNRQWPPGSASSGPGGASLWEWIELLEVDYERIRTNTVRGYLARVEGWVQRP